MVTLVSQSLHSGFDKAVFCQVSNLSHSRSEVRLPGLVALLCDVLHSKVSPVTPSTLLSGVMQGYSTAGIA